MPNHTNIKKCPICKGTPELNIRDIHGYIGVKSYQYECRCGYPHTKRSTDILVSSDIAKQQAKRFWNSEVKYIENLMKGGKTHEQTN